MFLMVNFDNYSSALLQMIFSDLSIPDLSVDSGTDKVPST